MTWLSENPWPLAGTFGTLAVIFLIALKVTQQAKYLMWAGIALGLALLVIVVEQLWVTDAERIEAVVNDLGRAVKRSDADAVLAHLTPGVSLVQHGTTIGGRQLEAARQRFPKLDVGAVNPARSAIRSTLQNTQFDYLLISHVSATAGRYTRAGTASFRVSCMGSFDAGGTRFNFATDPSGTDWSLEFREVDGRWMVDTITAVRLPRGWELPLGGRVP